MQKILFNILNYYTLFLIEKNSRSYNLKFYTTEIKMKLLWFLKLKGQIKNISLET